MNWNQDEPDLSFGLRNDYGGADPYPRDHQSFGVDHLMHVPDPTLTLDGWDPVEELAEMLSAAAGSGPPTPLMDSAGRPRHRVDRRRSRPGLRLPAGRRRVIPTAVLVSIITACSVAMLGWSISYSYRQLSAVASLVVPPPLAQWWPLTVYGPWLVAGSSVLLASVQRRPTHRSWAIMLLSSGTAVALSVGNSPHSALSMAVSGIPPITALACFRELVGQIFFAPGPRHALHSAKESEDG
ncbi:DUF2637 domain-containing protein [Streptomyces sp. NBC_01622]|uniref:DUF2637 domain-containing protein n=1 Tax=Streptomyces sp. NBC_01622 TaxID=2975903 RepID=UPI0038654795|nr:DUF2637 domain-containing protein [Streptomyces sp. NBC_01622]